MQAIIKLSAFITYREVTKPSSFSDSLLSGWCYLSVHPHTGLSLPLAIYDTCKERKREEEIKRKKKGGGEERGERKRERERKKKKNKERKKDRQRGG